MHMTRNYEEDELYAKFRRVYPENQDIPATYANTGINWMSSFVYLIEVIFNLQPWPVDHISNSSRIIFWLIYVIFVCIICLNGLISIMTASLPNNFSEEGRRERRVTRELKQYVYASPDETKRPVKLSRIGLISLRLIIQHLSKNNRIDRLTSRFSQNARSVIRKLSIIDNFEEFGPNSRITNELRFPLHDGAGNAGLPKNSITSSNKLNAPDGNSGMETLLNIIAKRKTKIKDEVSTIMSVANIKLHLLASDLVKERKENKFDLNDRKNAIDVKETVTDMRDQTMQETVVRKEVPPPPQWFRRNGRLAARWPPPMVDERSMHGSLRCKRLRSCARLRTR